MRKTMTLWIAMLLTAASLHAQEATTAGDVLATLRRANDYFMAKYNDPTRATYVKRCDRARYGRVPSTTRASWRSTTSTHNSATPTT